MIVAGIILAAFLIWVNLNLVCDLISDIQEHFRNKKSDIDLAEMYRVERMGVANDLDNDTRRY